MRIRVLSTLVLLLALSATVGCVAPVNGRVSYEMPSQTVLVRTQPGATRLVAAIQVLDIEGLQEFGLAGAELAVISGMLRDATLEAQFALALEKSVYDPAAVYMAQTHARSAQQLGLMAIMRLDQWTRTYVIHYDDCATSWDVQLVEPMRMRTCVVLNDVLYTVTEQQRLPLFGLMEAINHVIAPKTSSAS